MLTAVLPALCADSGEEEIFSLHLIPGVSIPIGTDAGVYTIGGAGTLLARMSMPGFQYLSLEVGGSYSICPVSLAAGSPYDSLLLNIVAGKLGVGFRVPLGNFVLGAHAYGGYYWGFLNQDMPDNSGSNPLLDAGVEFKYRFSPYLSLGIDASYRNFFGLDNDILIGIGVSYHFPLVKGGGITGPQEKPYPQLELLNVTLDDVFPVFYTYYSDHKLGTIDIRNNGKVPLENVKVKIFVNQYMDNPYTCKEIAFITGGGKEKVDLTALFNEKILSITEDTKVQVAVVVESAVAGDKYANQRVETLRVYNRNAMTWDDDRRAAAFVGTKDPAVLKFSKNVTSFIKDKASKAINKNFLTALALFEALKIYGLSYAVDPTSPFTERSKSKTAVDYLQFPPQTLNYKAGDCDDLSILYAALLESVGIKTAFVTVPGHIYVAVSLDLPPLQAQKELLNTNDLIYRDNTAWLPVEVTALSGGFLAAWQSGIKLWKEQEPKGQAKLIVIQDAWRSFDPVGLSGEGPAMILPAEDAVVSAYLKEVMKYIDRDLYPQTKKLEEQIKADPDNAALLNKLGVLHARYAVGNDFTKAEAAFKRILAKKSDFQPALVNMGNVAFLKNNFKEARSYYEKAFAKDPNDPATLLNLAKLSYEEGQYDKTGTYYSMLAKRDKPLADRYQYLAMKGEGGNARASQADALKTAVAWGE
jgi:tetratricopeptide (TPR) repeat protein